MTSQAGHHVRQRSHAAAASAPHLRAPHAALPPSLRAGWALGAQLSFWTFISIAWCTGFLERHAMPMFGELLVSKSRTPGLSCLS
jgi:hypothetical protein